MNFIKKCSWLIPSLSFTLVMILCRVCYTGNLTFAFMPWNLLLGILPLYFSYKLETADNKYTGWCLAALWLLFFPNAMYITTDLFHLKERGDIPRWYDLLLLMSAALNGVIMGFASLYKIEKWLLGFIRQKHISIIVFLMLVMCGYGIYLGRYERWNSWDVLVQPGLLLYDMIHHFIHPFRNIDIWVLSFAFGIWMYLLYRYSSRLNVT